MSKYVKSTHREFAGVAKKEKNTVPETYLCESCARCNSDYCNKFHRPIISDYNRCFHHVFKFTEAEWTGEDIKCSN